MGLLFRVGKPAFVSGKPLIGDAVDCCCGACCCVGALTCCQAEADFTPGMDCGGANHSITVRWQWQVNGAFCRFVWEIIDNQLIGLNGANGYADYLEPQCTAPNGVWSWDELDFGDHGVFAGSNAAQPNARCLYEAATVTISKSGDGYQFVVAGVTAAAGWGCDCAAMNATYVVEC